ncbi:MAG: hypothetical protein JST55_15515 [Bacteroidetes bacterium]|nr:hypothetical protein [Bacteroidota bacterium]
MINNKIFEWLRDFDEGYLKNFRDFINSPYFNSNKKVKTLFDIIYSTRPDFNSKKLESKNLLSKLFPGKEKTSEQALKNLFSEISGLIKEFITHNSLKRNDYTKESLYADELFYISKYKEGAKHSENMLAKLKEDEIFSTQYFDAYTKSINNLSRFYYMENRNYDAVDLSARVYEVFLLKLVYDFIDIKNGIGAYYNSEKGIEIPEFITTFEKSFNLKNIIDGLKKFNRKNADVLDIYYNLFIMFESENDEKLFFTTRDKVFKNIEKFSYEEKYFLYTALTSYIYTNLGAKDPKYYKDAFEIIKFFIEKEVYIYPGSPYMINVNYENIYSCSTFAEDDAWTENFLTEYKKYLKPEFRDILYHKTMVDFTLSRGRLDEALNHINSYKAIDTYEKIQIKIYTIIIFYEKGDIERSLYEYDNLVHYFSYNNEKIPKNVDIIMKNMVPTIKKVLFAKANNKKLDYADYMKFKDAPDILHKRWVIKKMEELL